MEEPATKPATEYEVELHVVEPKIESERRFVASELRYVRQRIADLERAWRPVKLAAIGVFRKKDWQDYAHKLEHYKHELDKHEREVTEEWLPFQVFVANVGRHDDANVRVKIMVDHGSISDKKEAPERPERLDGGARSSKTPLPRFSGFARRMLKVDHHDMRVEFSRLEAGSAAEVTRQTLYLHYSGHTRLHFTLSSKLVDHLAGDVLI